MQMHTANQLRIEQTGANAAFLGTTGLISSTSIYSSELETNGH